MSTELAALSLTVQHKGGHWIRQNPENPQGCSENPQRLSLFLISHLRCLPPIHLLTGGRRALRACSAGPGSSHRGACCSPDPCCGSELENSPACHPWGSRVACGGRATSKAVAWKRRGPLARTRSLLPTLDERRGYAEQGGGCQSASKLEWETKGSRSVLCYCRLG